MKPKIKTDFVKTSAIFTRQRVSVYPSDNRQRNQNRIKLAGRFKERNRQVFNLKFKT